MPNSDDSPVIDSPAADRLEGAGAIARWLYGDDNSATRHKVYNEFRKGRLPLGRRGARLVGSKRRLAQHHAEQSGALINGAEPAIVEPEPNAARAIIMRRRN